MILLSFLLLLSGQERLFWEGTVDVSNGSWNYVDVAAAVPNTIVRCEFEVISSRAEARVVWIAHKDLDLFRYDQSKNVLGASAFGASGALRSVAPAAGNYAIVIENPPSSRAPAKVKLKVWLRSPVNPQYASPERRLVVILLSCIVFVGMVSFSAYKLSGK